MKIFYPPNDANAIYNYIQQQNIDVAEASQAEPNQVKPSNTKQMDITFIYLLK